MKNWKPVKPPFAKFKKTVFENASKVSDFIYQIGETPNLRVSSRQISVEEIKTQVTKAKILYLKKCLNKYRKLTGYGRGISAIQVGINERIAAVYTPEKIIIIINPKITKQSDELLLYPEMCMSGAPIIAPVIRPSSIEFNYLDDRGIPKVWNTKDDTDVGRIMNRVFQHEIDHMDGIINIDRVKSAKDLILESDPSFYRNAKFTKIK